MKLINKKYHFVILLIFLIIELTLFTIFMYLDVFHSNEYILSSRLKFVGVILCFLFSLLPLDVIFKKKNRIIEKQKHLINDILIVRLALLFTVISDLFILILDYYTIGLMTFILVQLLYLIRLVLWSKKDNKKLSLFIKLLRNVSIFIVVLIVLYIFQVELEILIILSCFYFVSIFFNVIDVILCSFYKRDKNSLLFICGMILFLLCDINVGLFNLGDFVSIGGNWLSTLYSFSTIAMWMFYLPSQVLISLSTKFSK
jgi:hypothetical protein